MFLSFPGRNTYINDESHTLTYKHIWVMQGRIQDIHEGGVQHIKAMRKNVRGKNARWECVGGGAFRACPPSPQDPPQSWEHKRE